MQASINLPLDTRLSPCGNRTEHLIVSKLQQYSEFVLLVTRSRVLWCYVSEYVSGCRRVMISLPGYEWHHLKKKRFNNTTMCADDRAPDKWAWSVSNTACHSGVTLSDFYTRPHGHVPLTLYHRHNCQKLVRTVKLSRIVFSKETKIMQDKTLFVANNILVFWCRNWTIIGVDYFLTILDNKKAQLQVLWGPVGTRSSRIFTWGIVKFTVPHS